MNLPPSQPKPDAHCINVRFSDEAPVSKLGLTVEGVTSRIKDRLTEEELLLAPPASTLKFRGVIMSQFSVSDLAVSYFVIERECMEMGITNLVELGDYDRALKVWRQPTWRPQKPLFRGLDFEKSDLPDRKTKRNLRIFGTVCALVILSPAFLAIAMLRPSPGVSGLIVLPSVVFITLIARAGSRKLGKK